MTLSGILMCIRSTVTDSTKANFCFVLSIEKSFDGAKIGFWLLLEKIDTFLDNLFLFGLREALESMKILPWHMECAKPINKLV